MSSKTSWPNSFKRAGCDSAFSDMNGTDMAVRGELEPVDADDAMVGIGLAERAAMVHDIVFVGAADMDDRVVPRAGSHGGILLEDLADALERPRGFIGHGIGHGIVGTAPAPLRPHKIILPVAQHHIRTLYIVLWRDLFEGRSVGERNESFEIGAKLNDIAMAPAAVDHIVLAVFIFKDGLIDGLRAVMELADERFAEIVFIGSFRTIGDRNADASPGRIVLDVVGGEEEVVAAAFFCDGGRPHGAVRPADGGSVEDMGIFGPLYEIGRGEGVEEDLFIIFIRIGRIDPIGRVEDSGFRVGVPAGEDRIARSRGQGVIFTSIRNLGECLYGV